MHTPDFTNTAHAITTADLNELEEKYGFAFPQDFRLHYLRYNGGSPTKCLYNKGGDIFVLQEFLPVKFGEGRLEDSFRHLTVEDAILPAHLVPFAVDPGGDYYCFSTREEDRGSIWFYIGEYRDEPDRAVEYLAKSLPDFMERMTEEED